MLDITLKTQLVSYRKEHPYTIYVFKNLDLPEYIMCTRFPNWNTPLIDIGDKGFLNYRIVIAGRDTWYDQEKDVLVPYKYSGNHFVNFIPLKEKLKDIILD